MLKKNLNCESFQLNRNFLVKLRDYGLVTHEIQEVSRRLRTNLSNAGDRDRAAEKLVLGYRIDSAEKMIRSTKKMWSRALYAAQRALIENNKIGDYQLLINRYKNIKWVELQYYWYENTARFKKKFTRIRRKRYL